MAPLIVWKKELRQDSGGAGEFRGGLGQECEIEIRSQGPLQLSLLSDRWHLPAQGVLRYAGGGGNGDPAKRDKDQVRQDIEDGYISPAAAKRDYGVS